MNTTLTPNSGGPPLPGLTVDRAAFDKLYESLAKPVWQAALAATHGDENRAADVAQGVWMRILRKLSSDAGYLRLESQDPKPLKGLLYLMTRQVAEDLRRRARRPAGSLDQAIETGHEPVASADADPLEFEDTASAIREAVESLDQEKRPCVELRLAGLTFDEIATRMGSPLATVVSRVYRGFAEIRGFLESHYPQLYESLRFRLDEVAEMSPTDTPRHKRNETSPKNPSVGGTGGTCS
jgi:RNA polymerase sigma-70 factor (ECF subfamily)